jgi:hypothetical protein
VTRSVLGRAAVLVALGTLVGSASCAGSDADGPDGPSLSAFPREAVENVFAERLADLDREITTVGLIERTAGAGATHLAVYLAPTTPLTPDEYAAGMWTITDALATDVFERWPEVQSFDVCQVASADVDANGYPTDDPSTATDEQDTVTLVDMRRDQAANIDWNGGALADLLRPGAVTAYSVTSEVEDSATFQSARATGAN